MKILRFYVRILGDIMQRKVKTKNVTLKRSLSFFMSLVLMLTVIFSVGVSPVSAATTGKWGDATWKYDAATSTLTISGTGASKDCGAMINKAPWTSYKDKITTLVVEEGITSLGYYSFFNMTKLTKVSLPSTLTKIGGLGTVVSDEGSYGCFQDCTALEEITLPKNLTTINSCAFRGCTALKSITIPDSVTTIGNGVFAGCTSLADVTYGSGLKETGDYAFWNAGVKRVTWGKNIKTLTQYTFFGCQMTEIEIPDSVTSIGLRSLANCDFLKKITVSNANAKFTGDPCADSSQTVTVYGHSASTAETYAKNKGYQFVSIDSCSHESTHDVITKAATCTEKGSKNTVCDNCGAVTSTKEISALGHNFVVNDTVDNHLVDGHIYTSYKCSREGCTETKEKIEHYRLTDGETRYLWCDGFYEHTNTATCQKTGIETFKCTVEGCNVSESHISQKTGHSIQDYEIVTPATCTTDGKKKGHCSICDQDVEETIPATGHQYSSAEGSPDLVKKIDNTTEDGHIHEIYACRTCGEQIDVTDHVAWVDGVYTSNTITEVTCRVDGVRVDTCKLCNKKRTVTIPSNGEHKYVATGNTTAATCTTRGSVEYKCSVCGRTKTEYSDALGHDYVKSDADSKAPTCTENGYDYYKCSRCSQTKQETVVALGHTADESQTTIVVEPSCEETGKAVSVCTRCSKEFEFTLAALGHDYQDVVKDLTSENKPGHSLVTPTCSHCGRTKTASIRHDEWLDGYYTNADTMASTCTVQGYTTDTCTICNTTRQNLKAALGHNFNMTGNVTSEGIQYRCSHCLRTTYIAGELLMSYWSNDLLNSKDIHRTAVDNTSYLDTNGDGVINGKDFAAILHSYAVYKQKVKEEQSSSGSGSGTDTGTGSGSDSGTDSNNTESSDTNA